MLSLAYENRLMYEAALPIMDQLLARHPINRDQIRMQDEMRTKRAQYQKKLVSPPQTSWRNLTELNQIAATMLAEGRAESAAELLEGAYPPERAPWEMLDQIATLRLHLGESAKARALWQKAASSTAPESALALSRIGTTYLAEGNFDAARQAYHQALKAKPDLFEACYSLAVLEQDGGNATAAHEWATRAVAIAPKDLSRTAAQSIAIAVAGFADVVKTARPSRPASGTAPSVPSKESAIKPSP